MKVNRVTNRSSTPAPTPSALRSPGQHEDILDRLKNGFKDVLNALSKQHNDCKVVVELDTSIQREMLVVLKVIESNVGGIGGLPGWMSDIEKQLILLNRGQEQIMATLAELQGEVQRLIDANTALTSTIEAEHVEVMAKLDELNATIVSLQQQIDDLLANGNIDQATFDSLKAQVDAVSAQAAAVSGIYNSTPPAPPSAGKKK